MALIIAEMSLKILSQHEVKNIWENSLQMPPKNQTNQTQTKPVQGWRERSTLNRVLIMWKHSLVCEWTLKKWLQIYLKNNPSLGRGLRLTVVVVLFFQGSFLTHLWTWSTLTWTLRQQGCLVFWTEQFHHRGEEEEEDEDEDEVGPF